MNTKEPPVAEREVGPWKHQRPSDIPVPRPLRDTPGCSESKCSRIPRQEVLKTPPNSHYPPPKKSFGKMFSLLEGKTCPCLKQLDQANALPARSELQISRINPHPPPRLLPREGQKVPKTDSFASMIFKRAEVGCEAAVPPRLGWCGLCLRLGSKEEPRLALMRKEPRK